MENVHCIKAGRQAEIQQRPEWHGVISEVEATERLEGQPPLTYLLRGTDQSDKFYLSFVQLDSTVDHRFFIMDGCRNEWFYQNLDAHYATVLQLLIPQIMHCLPQECLPLHDQYAIKPC